MNHDYHGAFQAKGGNFSTASEEGILKVWCFEMKQFQDGGFDLTSMMFR